MQFLTHILLVASIVSAQSTVPATPPKGTQLDNPPILGLGTWGIHDGGVNVTEIVASAIQSGYRHIDLASYYANQKLIGPGIKEGLRRTGLSRGDIWVSSKLWNTRWVDLIAASYTSLFWRDTFS
jgi:diketogulonate reductase-like aldo/keto reductase